MPALTPDAADTLRLVRQLKLLDEDEARLLEQLFANRFDESLITTLIRGKELLIASALFKVCVDTHSTHVLGYTLRFLADLVYADKSLAQELGKENDRSHADNDSINNDDKSLFANDFGANVAETFLMFVNQHRQEHGIANPALYLASVTLRHVTHVEHNTKAIETFFAIIRDTFSLQLLQVSDVQFAIQGCVQLARRKELRKFFFMEDVVRFIPRLLTGVVSADAASVIQMIYETLLLT